MSRTLAICNQKGGVGKTTTTFQLARAAVRRGMSVLLIDNDPQGNLTRAATVEPVSPGQVGLADVLSDRTAETLNDVIVEGVWPGMDVVPTVGETLGAVRDELVIAGAGRESRLRQAIRGLNEGYDLIIIDCAPSLDQLTINAFTAADEALIVSEAKLFATDGLAKLLATIETVQQSYNEGLQVAGVVMNSHQGETVSGRTWLKEVRHALDERSLVVFEPPIPRRVVISDATEAGKGLDEYGTSTATGLGSLYLDLIDSLTRKAAV